MARCFNAREGISADDETLPDRFFEPLPAGVLAGKHLDRETFQAMKGLYYRLCGWDRTQASPLARSCGSWNSDGLSLRWNGSMMPGVNSSFNDGGQDRALRGIACDLWCERDSAESAGGVDACEALDVLVQQGGQNAENAIRQPDGTYGVSLFVNGQPRKDDWVLGLGDAIRIIVPAGRRIVRQVVHHGSCDGEQLPNVVHGGEESLRSRVGRERGWSVTGRCSRNWRWLKKYTEQPADRRRTLVIGKDRKTTRFPRGPKRVVWVGR